MRAEKGVLGALGTKGWVPKTTLVLFVCSLAINVCFFWITDCRRPIEARGFDAVPDLGGSGEVAQLRRQVDGLKEQLVGLGQGGVEVTSERDAGVPSDAVLLAALKKAATKANQVVLLPVSIEFVAELENFVWHAQKVALHANIVVVALDAHVAKVSKGLEKNGQIGAVFDMSDESNWRGPKGLQFGFTAKRWSLAVRNVRYSVLLRCLEQGYHVLSTDADVVFLKNPFVGDYLGNGFDLQIMSNSHASFAQEGEDGTLHEVYVSGGLHYSVAKQPRLLHFYRSMLASFAQDRQLQAEDFFNKALQFGKARVKWRYLEPLLFPNGYLYFDRGMPQHMGVQPFAVHNNWCKGRRTKVYRFREAGLWAAEEAHWAAARKSGKKYLAYFNPVGDNGLNNDRQAFRAALAIAQVLNRTLIMPEFHRLHHYHTPVTFEYYFDYEAFDKVFPEVEPKSFLAGAFPNWRNGQIHFINIGFPPDMSSEKTEASQFLDRIKQHTAKGYHRGATEAELVEWFGSSKEQVLVLFNCFRRFGSWSDPAVQKAWSLKLLSAIRPHWKTTAIAEVVKKRIQDVSKTGAYNCLHLRLTDFKTVHADSEQPVEALARKMPALLPTNTTLYISSDEQTEEVRKEFYKAGYKQVIFMTDFFPKWGWPHVLSVDGRVSMRFGQPDQQACAGAEKFIGNVWSTFSLYIAFVREQEGRKQVCEDVYGRVLDDGMIWQR